MDFFVALALTMGQQQSGFRLTLTTLPAMKSKITKQKWFVENYGQPLAESQMLYQKQGEFFRASATANERCGHSYGHSFARASFFIGNKPDNPIQPITEMQAKVFWPNLTKD